MVLYHVILQRRLLYAMPYYCMMSFVISHLWHACAQVIKTLNRYDCLSVWKQSGNFSGKTENLADVLLHDICERIFPSLFFLFSHKREMRNGTHLRQPDVFLPVKNGAELFWREEKRTKNNERSLFFHMIFTTRLVGRLDWKKREGNTQGAEKQRFWHDSIFSCNRRLQESFSYVALG